MRTLVLSTGAIAGVVWIGIAPANAAPPSMSGISNTNIKVGTVNIGYWRRYYRRYGYPVPYAYYPPAYGSYVPPAAYTYPPATSYAPPPEADYGDAPPSEGDYNDEGNYGNGQPQEGDYAGAPPPEVTNRTTAIRIRANVCFWHLADVYTGAEHVRSGGLSGHRASTI